MLFKKTSHHTNFDQVKKTKTVADSMYYRGLSAAQSTFVIAGTKREKKNELLYPVSPYNEIPTIRDLYEQLSPKPRTGRQEEIRQERQDFSCRYQQECQHGWRRKSQDRPTSGRQERDRVLQDAHEVPFIIEIPSSPSDSEDSELSFDEKLLQNEEDERERECECDHRSLTPHPSYDHFYHAFVKAEQDADWPSDEDNLSTQKKMITKNRKHQQTTNRHHHRVRLV